MLVGIVVFGLVVGCEESSLLESNVEPSEDSGCDENEDRDCVVDVPPDGE
jgi:hypothetical protein